MPYARRYLQIAFQFSKVWKLICNKYLGTYSKQQNKISVTSNSFKCRISFCCYSFVFLQIFKTCESQFENIDGRQIFF